MKTAHAYSDAFTNVKRMMCAQGRTHRVFALEYRVSKDIDTLLFINKLRFDIAAHTVVCKAFVLALSQAISKNTFSWRDPELLCRAG